MRKRISVFRIMGVCVLLLIGGMIGKGIALHGRYPDPPVDTYQYGETVAVGSYLITFGGWTWGDDTLIKGEFPDYVLSYPDNNGDHSGVRVGLIGFTVTKILEGEDVLSFADICFSSGAWGNQFDLELFYMLNPQNGSMVMDLDVGESREVTLPLVMLEPQFTAGQWKKIDRRPVYIVFQYYPKQLQFACPIR